MPSLHRLARLLSGVLHTSTSRRYLLQRRTRWFTKHFFRSVLGSSLWKHLASIGMVDD